MTRPAHHPMSEQTRRQIAALIQLHMETHPDRIGRRFGITAAYARMLWNDTHAHEMPSVQEALAALRGVGKAA